MVCILLLSSSCKVELKECAGAPLETSSLQQFKEGRFLTGPQAYLVLPNPIDSPRLNLFSFSSSTFRNAQQGVGLPNLGGEVGLENGFVRVRRYNRYDDLSLLANKYDLNLASQEIRDSKYSQVMAYHAITSITDYVEKLGFRVDKSRNLFVMVQSADDPERAGTTSTSTQVNAYYTHNQNSPGKPRLIQIFGDNQNQYPLGADRDVFWHEFGHLFNESLTASKGIDEATEQGALYTEGGALHECLADYLSESASDKGYIGRWAAKNMSHIPPGNPLRSAIAMNDGKNNFSSVSNYDSSAPTPDQGAPDKYEVAEWCSRVLWDIRSQFVKEDPKTGALFSDRTVFSAVGLLGKNASVSEFRRALLTSDQQLHCGLHQNSIKKAFSSRGFTETQGALSKGLTIQARAVGFKDSSSGVQTVTPNLSADEIGFQIVINNPNVTVARNVRLELLATDAAVIPYREVQGFGDLGAGGSIRLISNNYQDFFASVTFSLDSQYSVGKRSVKVYLRVSVENGPETILPVEITP